LITQIAMAPVAWVLTWATSKEPTLGGNICPDIDPGSALESVMLVLFFGSFVVGGIAVVGAYRTYRPRLTQPIVFAIIALFAPFGILAALVYDVLCSIN
jgi:hypothetical protein